MASNILHKRNALTGVAPTTGQLALGEIAINTFDGTLYIKKDNGVESIVTLAVGGAGANQLSDLTDVNTSTPTNRFVLVADGVDFESRLLVEADISNLGTYEPADATILKDADIGVTVQAYDATYLVDADIGVNVQAYNADILTLQNNLAAAVDPTANEDSGDGYAVGSRWINTTLDKEFVLLDATVTSAVWTETTGAGGSGGEDYVTINSSATLPTAVGADAISIGPASTAGGTKSTAVGYNADSTTSNALALGRNTTASGNSSTAMGYASSAGGQSTLCIGHGVTSSGSYNIGIGGRTVTLSTLTNQIAIGSSITAASVTSNVAYSVRLGHGTGVNKNMLHMFDAGKMELYGTKAQIIVPKYATASEPANPLEGSLIYDSTLDVLKTYDGAAWATTTSDLGEFTIAGLPAASSHPNCWALATDASGGRTVVRSDGTNWKVIAVEGATVA